MQGLFFEDDTVVRYFLRGIVLLLGFWTAWRSGKAAAEGWNGYREVVIYAVLLTCAMQFLHYALFAGPILNAFYFILDLILLLGFALAGFRLRRTRQMVQNYYWLYESTSAFSWRKKD
jgi:hypothetical protein